MALPREVVVPGFLQEYRNCADVLREVDADRWASPSRCQGWAVADVAGHVIGQLGDVVNFRLDGLGTDDANERQVRERRGRSAVDLFTELEPLIGAAGDVANALDEKAWDAPAPGDRGGTLGDAVLTLWFDTFVHLDDMRSALGLCTVLDSGLLAAIYHVTDVLTDRSWGPWTLDFGELGRFDISGGGADIVCEPMGFVLAATGRLDPGDVGLDPNVVIFG